MEISSSLIQKYHSSYIASYPRTLTIVQNKKSILQNLYSFASFFWIVAEKGDLCKQIEDQFQKYIQEPLTCCQSIQQAKTLMKNHETAVIICQSSVLKNKISTFQSDISAKKITHIICIGPPFSHNQNRISFVHKKENVFGEILENKFSYKKSNDFINFMFLSKEVQESSILVKTMFAMLNQHTNRAQMLQYMGQVARVACQPFQIKQVEQFLNKNLNPQNRISTPIRWYTKESFLYGFVNSILRLCKDPTALFVLQPYFKDLFLAIYQLYTEQQEIKQDQNHNYKSFYCYRGASISEKEVQQFKLNINSVVENLGFLSTSKQMEVANGFVINVLYQIEVNDDHRHPELDFGYAFVDKYSSKHGEQQIIFNPLNTFKILEVQQISQETPMYIIRLKYGELAKIVACDKQALSIEEIKYKILGQYRISQREKYNIIGDVLVEGNCSLQGSQQYCEKYLQIAQQSKNKIAISDGYYRLGDYYRNKGDHQKMIQNYQKIQNLGSNLTDIGIDQCHFLSKLGSAYFEFKQFQKAEQYLQKYLKLTKDMDRCYSSQSILALNNLSTVCLHLKKYQKALKYLQKIKRIQRQTKGQNNRLYFTILNNIGSVYYILEDYPKAIENFQSSLQLDKISVGEDNPICIKKYFNLAAAYFRSHQYSKALSLFAKAEMIENIYNGQNTHLYVSILKFYGIIYLKLNQYETSIKYLRRCKQSYETYNLITTYESDYAEILDNLGEVSTHLGNHHEAISFLRKSLQIGKRIFGQSDKKYINTLIILANTLIDLGQFEKGMRTLLETEFLQLKYLGQNTFQYSQILLGFGILYQKTDYFYEALSCLKRSKRIQENVFHVNSDKIYPKTLKQIGNLYMKLQQFQKAIVYFDESFNIKKKFLSQYHQEYVLILTNIGQAYKSLGQFKNALKIFEQLKNISEKIFGLDHPSYADSLNKLAIAHQNLGEFQQAAKLYKVSADIFRKTLGQKNSNYLKTLNRLSLILYDLGLYQAPTDTCFKNNDDKLLIDKLTKKENQIKQIFSRFKGKTALRIPSIKRILNQIESFFKQKKYPEAIKKIRWLRKLCKGENQPNNQLIQELNKREDEIFNIILSEISNYYDIADYLQSNGHYEEAQHMYSTFILMRFKETSFAIHEVLGQVENSLESLKNKQKIQINDSLVIDEPENEKQKFCFLDFQF